VIEAFKAVYPPALAVYLVCLFAGTIGSPLILAGFAGLGLAFIGWCLTPDKRPLPRIIWVALGLLVISHLLAVPGSIWWGAGNWELTISGVYWVLPALMVCLVADARVFPWLIICAAGHAGAIIYGGFTRWHLLEHANRAVMVNEGVPSGIAGNPNVASGLVLAGIVLVLWTGRWRWLLFPMAVAVLFTESRWAILILGAVILTAAVDGRITWHWLAAGVLGLFLTVVAIGFFLPGSYAVAGYQSFSAGTAGMVWNDVGVRLGVPAWPDIYPHGLVEHRGLHNVPLRMARETGAIGAGIWLALSAYALIKGVKSGAWWLMVLLLIISVLDHYTWRVHLGSLWFLAVGIISRNPSQGFSPNKQPKQP
jgi:hypothetical protein